MLVVLKAKQNDRDCQEDNEGSGNREGGWERGGEGGAVCTATVPKMGRRMGRGEERGRERLWSPLFLFYSGRIRKTYKVKGLEVEGVGGRGKEGSYPDSMNRG